MTSTNPQASRSATSPETPALVFRTQYTFADILEVNRWMPHNRIKRYITFAAALVMVGISFVVHPPPGVTRDPWVIWVAAGGVALLGAAVPYIAAGGGWLGTLKGPLEIRLGDVGIEFHSKGRVIPIYWDEIKAVVDTRNLLFLTRRSQNSVIIFPKRDMGEQERALRAMIHMYTSLGTP